ncbi:MAG: tetratricopeptide repeat protein [Maricaulis sp.]|jgi:TPR repeat protein|nr:tetratricopeptide repeat protein [Maricaulis sp.]
MSKLCLSAFVGVFMVLLSAFADTAVAQALPAPLTEQIQDCQSGNAQTCHGLGLSFAEGRIVARDYRESFRYHQAACNLEHLASCSDIASAFIEGRGVPQNSPAAAEIYRSNCQLGVSGSCALLGVYFANGLHGLNNFSDGMDLLERACELASEIGCLWAQQALEQHGDQASDIQHYADRHFALVEAGCYGPKPRACYALGDLYMNSAYLEHDRIAAQAAFERGCSRDHQLACTALTHLQE